MEQKLGRCVTAWCPGATSVVGVARLSGGASQETWSFDIVHPNGNTGAILRRAPVGYGAAPTRAAGLNAEATLMQLAHDAGLPSPQVLHVLQPQDELGTGFIMARVEGETIARKILRDAQFAEARPILARQLGKVVAGIHGLPASKLPELRQMTSTKEIADLEREYRSFDWPRPVWSAWQDSPVAPARKPGRSISSIPMATSARSCVARRLAMARRRRGRPGSTPRQR